MLIIRWITMIPIALIAALLVMNGLSIFFGLISFDISILEAFAIHLIIFMSLGAYYRAGLMIAPVKNDLAKWIISIPPLVYFILIILPVFFQAIASDIAYSELLKLEGFNSLSGKWQLLIICFSFGITVLPLTFIPCSILYKNDNT